MATTFGPEQLTRPSAGPAFDNHTDRFAAELASMSASHALDAQSRADPPPNPPFVFPAQPPSSSSAPSSFSRATGRRPMSAIETPSMGFGLCAENAEREHRSALPDFSFNPGALLPPDPQASFLLTPPVSPHSLGNLSSPSRPPKHGHRRGGSEFVGGRLREGNSIAVMSTSPTKSESGFMPPTFQPTKRRHRRGISGAISTNDLPILQPPVFDSSLGRGSSAPTSPTGFIKAENHVALAQPDQPTKAEPETVIEVKQSNTIKQPSSSNPSPESSPKQARAAPKARVGFSDTLEFIPRPLSLVSNETSSTVTARPGHSVSGSISSIVSAASPSGRESPAPLSRTPTRETSDSRPSTAGAILERTQDSTNPTSSPKRRNSIPTLLQFAEASKRDNPEPSPTKTSKRWSFFARDPSTGGSSPTKARPTSSSSSDSSPKAASASDNGSDTAGECVEVAPEKQKKSSKKSKKKKKVKVWAGSILPRKPKGYSKRSKPDVVRPPTPPASSVSREDEEEMYGEPELLDASTPTLTVTESPNPPEEKETPKSSMDDPTYPMIDLDAALGPFNTPLPLNPEWEAAQQAAGNAGKRRLHSAQGMKGFSGPGMHYHRRAESAPDLPPFDPGRAGMHRYNSSSTMADVFEEDEEDEYGNGRQRARVHAFERDTDSDSDATPPAAVTNDPLMDTQDKISIHSSSHSMRRTSSTLSDKDQISPGSVRAERSRSSLHDSVIVEELPSVIFRSPFMPAERNDNTDLVQQPSIRRPSGHKDLAPVDISPIHLPAPANVPNSPYAISHSSSFPSPRSPMSVEVQRISTAPSSVADENNFRSLLLMGEPGPEVRISVDYDIPSLTSSNSTMTRESMFLPSQRMSQPILREPRPVSVSSAAFGRRRSSLASLSRLISSSHGERSKLSMEVTQDNDSADKKAKNSRTRRLSRMMQFWKPTKEGTSK
ncbi:hypothetical protein FZEAL_9923 [Fusarium zealandicum]|uniref:Cell wall proline rich protein n=1 Tax=Fusarium zealandicum TaxID=1053134 RepID=A0A8H4XEC1_9HYPO|nr:hypothetical protein FZEAL_9923 [Fusarium zealandicum]